MRVAGLFAGIGGLEAGLSKAGHVAEVLCELNPAAQAVLAKRFDTDIESDVRTLRSLPSGVDLVCAGFPCQDLSQAGRGLGLAGPKSGLVFEVFRLLKSARPEWVLLENVPFMLRLGAGHAMLRIVEELENLGYRWAWRVVDTFGFALPQRRERVFLLASRKGDPADVLLADDSPLQRPTSELGRKAHGFYWTEGRTGLGWAPDAVPTLKNGSSIGIASPPAVLLPSGNVVTLDIRDGERLQGLPTDWTLPAEERVRKSFRWSLVGNAVSLPVARWIGDRLRRVGVYDNSRDTRFDAGRTLQRAARNDGKQRFGVKISVDPLGLAPKPLTEFLKWSAQPLSARATLGFLQRARKSSLRFEAGFLNAIECHLSKII